MVRSIKELEKLKHLITNIPEVTLNVAIIVKKEKL